MNVILEHDPRSSWVWDRAAVEAAVEELGITDTVTFRQLFGLTPATNSLGRTPVRPGHQVVEVESQLDVIAADGVTWHELSHAADNSEATREGTFKELEARNLLSEIFLGDDTHTPWEVKARRVSKQHEGESLTLKVRDKPSYAPDFPSWSAQPKEE